MVLLEDHLCLGIQLVCMPVQTVPKACTLGSQSRRHPPAGALHVGRHLGAWAIHAGAHGRAHGPHRAAHHVRHHALRVLLLQLSAAVLLALGQGHIHGLAVQHVLQEQWQCETPKWVAVQPAQGSFSLAVCSKQTWMSQSGHSTAAHLVHGSDRLGGLLTVAVAYEAKALGLASLIAHDLQEAGSESATQEVSTLPASQVATLVSTSGCAHRRLPPVCVMTAGFICTILDYRK